MHELQNKISVSGVLTISREMAERVVQSRNSDAAQLLLWLALHPQAEDSSQCARELAMEKNRFTAALDILSGQTLESAPPSDAASQAGKPADTVHTPNQSDQKQTFVQQLPEYSGEELAQALCDEHFSFLCSEAERCLRRPLRRHECSTLLALYEDVGIAAEVLALVLTYIARRTGESCPDGTQQKISFAQVRAEAMRWYENGVDTAEKAEEYIKELDHQQTLRNRVLKMLGITSRKPSPTELRYIDSFLALDPTLALIARAYDITVVKKGALVWPYMRSILMNWHQKGYKTPEDMERGEDRKNPISTPVSDVSNSGAQYENQVLEFLKNNEKV